MFHRCIRSGAFTSVTTLGCIGVSLHSSYPRAHCQSNRGTSIEAIRCQIGYKAVDDFVSSGMVVGIGRGSSPYFAVERLAQRTNTGELSNIVVVPSCDSIAKHAASKGLVVRELVSQPVVNLMIADALEADLSLNLMQAQDGGLLKERMLENAADQRVYTVDDSRLVTALGPGQPVSVEISPTSYEHTRGIIEALPAMQGCKIVLRRGGPGQPFPDGNSIAVSDSGNYIVDVYFPGPISSVERLCVELNSCTGVVTHSVVGSSRISAVEFDNGVRILPQMDEVDPLAIAGDDFVVLVGSSDAVRVVHRPSNIHKAGRVGEETPSEQQGISGWEDSSDLGTSVLQSLLHPPSRSPQDFDSIVNRGIN